MHGRIFHDRQRDARPTILQCQPGFEADETNHKKTVASKREVHVKRGISEDAGDELSKNRDCDTYTGSEQGCLVNMHR